MSADPKEAARRYFSGVARDYLERYYDPSTTRYPNLQLREAIVVRALRLAVPAVGRILDVGCGTGHFMIEAARAGYRIVGVDIAAPMVDAARSLLDGQPPELRARCVVEVADVERLGFPDGTFDAVTASGVFEYLAEDGKALGEVRRVLRPDGLALISCRNRAFNAFSANAYTVAELEGRTLGRLLRDAQTAIAGDAERIAELEAVFSEALREAAIKVSDHGPRATATPAEGARWEKTMDRRQHTVEEVRSAASAAGLELTAVSYFHFHPFPPAVQALLPEAARVLGLAMEVFSETALGMLFASGFVAHLRAR